MDPQMLVLPKIHHFLWRIWMDLDGFGYFHVFSTPPHQANIGKLPTLSGPHFSLPDGASSSRMSMGVTTC